MSMVDWIAGGTMVVVVVVVEEGEDEDEDEEVVVVGFSIFTRAGSTGMPKGKLALSGVGCVMTSKAKAGIGVIVL